jgi:hypothetical protein
LVKSITHGAALAKQRRRLKQQTKGGWRPRCIASPGKSH